ncbi:low temperature requirement protein A [Luteimonas gilva]|uniref:Low temperature requirement protein A n=1 Tax=Luteimonas gilva TaxID=2572684 RepID=A0A4U5JVU6_9GAMM|nr:low temperature requirement protein A [Luteimonas gilva]TKR32771.1 low temperature requirement protein A [Luteimonas gilva]
MTGQPRKSLLRARGGHDSSRVGMVELFFDLVFVFAVTQLSHTLLAHLDPLGALQVGLLFVAMWWAWVDTSWITNWFDPERLPVRSMLFALMLAGLVLSSSIPKAFDGNGMAFACGYAALQVGRSAFILWAFRNETTARRRNFERILIWLCVTSAMWIVGAFHDGATRLAWWTAAVAIEMIAPLSYFWVPGLGASSTRDWDVDAHHLAERCGLFIIIALGESLLVTGATFAERPWDAPTVAAFLSAFLGSVAMWWVYFDTGAERAIHRFAASDDPGRVARLAYTYLHMPIVAGIIVCAVADEIVLVHPGHAEDAGIAAILGGPALYLIGNALFKWATNDRRTPPLSHLAGLLLLFALVPFAFAHVFSALTLGIATTAILVLVAAWETIALRRPHRPAAS